MSKKNPSGLFALLRTPALQWICRFILAGIFVLASLGKIAHPYEFAEIIYGYRLVPDVLVYALALFLPWLELVAALYLIAGSMVRPAAFILTGLLGVFLLALGINALRGFDINCGCFSSDPGQSGGNLILTMARDVLFLLPGLVILIFSPNRDRSQNR